MGNRSEKNGASRSSAPAQLSLCCGESGLSNRNTARCKEVCVAASCGGALSCSGMVLPQCGHGLRSLTNERVGVKSSEVEKTRPRRHAGQGMRICLSLG
jgi:hypothetical protein